MWQGRKTEDQTEVEGWRGTVKDRLRLGGTVRKVCGTSSAPKHEAVGRRTACSPFFPTFPTESTCMSALPSPI